ncbi:hypothetical protein RKD37_001758 [Streptomyces ambofaciens]
MEADRAGAAAERAGDVVAAFAVRVEVADLLEFLGGDGVLVLVGHGHLPQGVRRPGRSRVKSGRASQGSGQTLQNPMLFNVSLICLPCASDVVTSLYVKRWEASQSSLFTPSPLIAEH